MIECQNAAKQYPDFKLDITMEVPENTITALLGLNGSGKTTLFRLLNGLMKPDSGTVSLFDENAWTLSPAAKQKIGAVLSESGFLPSLDIKQIRSILASFIRILIRIISILWSAGSDCLSRNRSVNFLME